VLYKNEMIQFLFLPSLTFMIFFSRNNSMSNCISACLDKKDTQFENKEDAIGCRVACADYL